MFLPFYLICISAQSSEVISRLTFAEMTYKSFFGKKISEIEIMNADLFEPYQDGHFHLDWPMSRGVAVNSLARLLAKFEHEYLPGKFTDIPAGTVLYEILEKFGGAFPPDSAGRFNPDSLLTKGELQYAIETVSELLLPHLQASERQIPETVYEYRPDNKFIEKCDSDELDRIRRMASAVPRDQMSPQNAFSLTTIEEGIKESVNALDSIEPIVFDLTALDNLDEEHDKEVTAFLTTLRDTLSGLLAKLNYSMMQIGAAVFVDPQSIDISEKVKLSIKENIDRIERLNNHIDSILQNKGKLN